MFVDSFVPDGISEAPRLQSERGSCPVICLSAGFRRVVQLSNWTLPVLNS